MLRNLELQADAPRTGSSGIRWMAGLVVAAAFTSNALGAAAAPGLQNADCMQCHGDKTLTKEEAGGKSRSLFVDEVKLKASVHGTNACVSCHRDLTAKHPDDNRAAKPVDCALCHERQSETYQASIHALALKAGESGAATCKDCHDSHAVLPPTSPASPLHRANLTKTCGQCHPQAAEDVRQSVHGKALAEGRREPPTCTDCHSEHNIEQLRTLSSLKIAEQVCSRCHASERLNTKYNLPTDRVKTFLESYHGLAAQFGSTRAANCASCHGYHLVLPSSDPRSWINRANLVRTCGKCHPGATANFSRGTVHLNGSAKGDLGSRVNYWVRLFYLTMIVGTISLLLAHDVLAWRKRLLELYRTKVRTVVRMNRGQRLQHLILLVSFFVLAVTGFALRYPDSWIAWLLGSDETLRRWSHRLAGLVMLGLGAYHVAYVALTTEGRQLLKDFLPGRKDAHDVVGGLRYLVRADAPKPRYARFGYPEKFEYWAVVWGTIIMGVTGLMVWFKIEVTRWLPRWAVDVATTIHYYEAILAILAIVVWHFYHVIFDPDVYPFNWAWWDGRVAANWYRAEHPLDPVAPAPPSQPGSRGGASAHPVASDLQRRLTSAATERAAAQGRQAQAPGSGAP
ncbi:MAG: cytochrome b/b6 domain-containing protein, partial [Verrucomicrobia bacterium]|nr:cytochrome b/b6 domain-containing protein [Verrucomicrobiota bacterium]